jgi:hypothetical protein
MSKRKNRKKNVDGFIFPVPFALVVIAGATLALAYVWLGCRCEAVGRDLKTLEARHEELRRSEVNEKYKWARLKSPENLERKLEQTGIQMQWPRQSQVIKLHRDNRIPGGEVMQRGALVQMSPRRVMNE